MLLFRRRSLFLSRVVQLQPIEENHIDQTEISKENKSSSLDHRDKMCHPDNKNDNAGLKLHNMNSYIVEIPAREFFLKTGFQDCSQGQSQNPVRDLPTMPLSLNKEDDLFTQLSLRHYSSAPHPPSASLSASMLSNSKSPSTLFDWPIQNNQEIPNLFVHNSGWIQLPHDVLRDCQFLH